MKSILPLLLSAVCAAAVAQTPQPAPARPGAGESDRMIKRPAEPYTDSSGASGSVVVPPSTGNEEILTQPGNVDPDMSSSTSEIDKKKRKELQDKADKKH